MMPLPYPMPPRTHDNGEERPRLTRNMEPNEVGIRIDERPRSVLAIAILPSFSSNVNKPRYIVTRIIADVKSMMREENSRRAIDTISRSSTSPADPDVVLCLMIEMFEERRIMVAPTRKLVMIINRKFAASTSNLGCSNEPETPAYPPL